MASYQVLKGAVHSCEVPLVMAVTKTRTGLELDWRWTGAFLNLAHCSLFTGAYMLALCEPMELAVNCELDHVKY